MTESIDLLRELERFTPRNWAIKDMRGKTLVVIEATTAIIAARRVPLLLHELPRIPQKFKVKRHHGPTATAWFGDGWFQIRAEMERLGADSEVTLFTRRRERLDA